MELIPSIIWNFIKIYFQIHIQYLFPNIIWIVNFSNIFLFNLKVVLPLNVTRSKVILTYWKIKLCFAWVL